MRRRAGAIGWRGSAGAVWPVSRPALRVPYADYVSALSRAGQIASVLHRRLLDGAGHDRRGRLLDTASALSTMDAAATGRRPGERCGQRPPRSDPVRRGRAGGRQQDVLLECLEILAVCRQRVGLTDEALVTGAEVADLSRDLAERRPRRYLTRIPESLHRYGPYLLWAGWPGEVYAERCWKGWCFAYRPAADPAAGAGPAGCAGAAAETLGGGGRIGPGTIILDRHAVCDGRSRYPVGAPCRWRT